MTHRTPRTSLSRAAVSIGCILAGASAVHADVFYSINTSCNTLVRIDSVTGAVEIVGELGMDINTCTDLAIHQGTLYALGVDFSVAADLVAINPATGAVLSTVPITINGVDIPHGEGLASAGGQLYIGFNHEPPNQFVSNTLGILALDGTISNEHIFPGVTDFDALGANVSGSHPLWGNDGCPTNTVNRIYGASLTPPANELAGSVFDDPPYVPLNDIVDTGDDLFLIENTDRLHRVDTQTITLLESIVLSRAGSYSGLAIAPDGSVCPADFDASTDIGVTDLLALLAEWGPCECCIADLDGDGEVSITDLLTLLSAWGACGDGQ